MIDFLLERFGKFGEDPALVFEGEVFSYHWLGSVYQTLHQQLDSQVPDGSVVAVEADFSPASVALLLVLLRKSCVFVPVTAASAKQKEDFYRIAEVEFVATLTEERQVAVRATGVPVTHPLLAQLKAIRHPGIVLFSSGSTGKPKAALHDFSFLLEKFHTERPKQVMIAFLLFDHIGGVNTLLSSLSTGGLLVTTPNRDPDTVCGLIEKYGIQTLPSTPTFLNLLLLKDGHRRFDLSSLKTITYGTEVMPESTLTRLHQAFPHARLHQTYGLSEIGIMRSKSESNDSLWVKIGGEGFETRVVNGLLEIKARSAMLGYLNAPSPFTDDGWFQTFDAVEMKGEFLRILGRQSEIINVGGEKVYPAEVESILQMMPEVEGVVVTGERNPIVGNIVKAQVRLKPGVTLSEFRPRMREFCQQRLPKYKIPQKVEQLQDVEWSERFKKIRHQPTAPSADTVV